MSDISVAGAPDQKHLYTVLGSFQGKKHYPGIIVDADAFIKCVQVRGEGSIKVGIIYDTAKKEYLSHVLGESPTSSEGSGPVELEQVSLEDLGELSQEQEPSYVPEEPEFIDAQEPVSDVSTDEGSDATPLDVEEAPVEVSSVVPVSDVAESSSVVSDSVSTDEGSDSVSEKDDSKKISRQAVIGDALIKEMSEKYPIMHFFEKEHKVFIPERFFDEIHVYGEFKHLYSNLYRLQPICCESAFLVFNSKENLLICSACSAKYPNTIPVKPKPSITF